MKKLLIIALFASQPLLAQKRVAEMSLNLSNTQYNLDLAFRRNWRSITFKVCGGFGQYGRKNFKKIDVQNGENTPYKEYDYLTFAALTGFVAQQVTSYTTSNIGYKLGLAFGYTNVINEKHRLIFEFQLERFACTNKSTLRYSAVSNPTVVINDVFREEKTIGAGVGLSASHFITIKPKLNFLYGIVLPYMVSLPLKGLGAYDAAPNKKNLMYGIEPYFKIGIQFNLSKKSKDEKAN